MTLGGLAAAIGLVIDDAIVVVENIAVHREAGDSRVEAVRKAIREISRPLVFSTITPVIVFLPLISVTGVTGSFFRALAVTMTVALLISLLLALTFTPALSLRLTGKIHTAAAPPANVRRTKSGRANSPAALTQGRPTLRPPAPVPRALAGLVPPPPHRPGRGLRSAHPRGLLQL